MPLKLSTLYEESGSRSMTQVFAGINKNLRSADGEFYDMKNLTSDHAPVLSVREPRYVPKSWGANHPTDIVAGVGAVEGSNTRGVCWIDGRRLRLGDQTIDLSGLGLVEGLERNVVKLGAYLIIVPDMIYVNTVNTSDRGLIEDTFEVSGATFTLAVRDYEGNAPKTVGDKKPDGASNGDVWLDTSVDGSPVLKKYAEESGDWYRVESYITISAIMLGGPGGTTEIVNFVTKTAMRAGDTVKISGIDDAVDGQKMIMMVGERTSEQDTTVSSIVVQGIMNVSFKQINDVASARIERVIPRMDYVCEAGNRLWGCRYGDNGDGEFVNEIYCSARGDFYRWILGESTDDDAPVTFSVGTDGQWTGCINYGGYPTFFKESTIHRVSGYGASGFALQDAPCAGVQPGAHRSLAVVNNVLYYKSAASVMGYDGSVPVNVSDKLGRLSAYNNAVGGACGGKYYLSMWKKKNGSVSDPVLMVLDTERGMWHKEDNIECESMAAAGDNLFFVETDRSSTNPTHTIKAVRIPDDNSVATDKEQDRIQWYAETGVIGLEMPDSKYVGRLAVRLHMSPGSNVRVLVQYDSCGYWKQIAGTEAAAMKTVTMPVIPARCDHMRLRLEGVGGCKVYSITKTVESGEEA